MNTGSEKTSVRPGAPVHSRAGGYRPSEEALEVKQDGLGLPTSMDFSVGRQWSIAKLSKQTTESLMICCFIFVVNETVTALQMNYWRPVVWSIFWILLTSSLAILGSMASRARNTFALIICVIYQIMFAVINLGHLNMSHSESVRNCRIPQIDFKNCNNPALAHCIQTHQTYGHAGTCTADELLVVDPPCHAPGSEQCTIFSHMDTIFWLNQVVNFFSYAEPCCWMVLLVIRLEIAHQHEGGDHSHYRKTLKDHHDGPQAEALPQEGADQRYSWLAATGLLFLFCGMLTMTIYMHVVEKS